MKHKEKVKIATAVFILIVLVLLIVVGVYIFRNRRTTPVDQSQTSAEVPSQSGANTITYEGEQYRYNTNLTNILFLGVDKNEPVTLQNTPGTAGQSDCIMILSLNSEDNTARILQIPRDTMTEVDIYDVNGNYYTSLQAQVATQYAYGNGKENSCWAAKKKIGELLYGLPIDGYLSMNIDGISTLNDAVGGVTITFDEDYTSVDPAFVKGETLTLTGDQAERYVRYRDVTQFGSADDRMVRQTQYIPALISTIKSKLGNVGALYESFFPVLQPYIVTDLSADQINSLSKYSYQPELTETVPGERKMGAKNEEFYANDAELRELLIKVFYKSVSK